MKNEPAGDTHAVNRLVIIRYQERGKVKFHTAGVSASDTDASIREWWLRRHPNASVLAITFEERD